MNNRNYNLWVVCTVLLSSLYLISSSPVKHVSCSNQTPGAFDNCFYFGQFGSNLRGKIHPPTAQRSSCLVMFDPSPDTIEESHTRLQRTQQVLQFSFDVGRSRPLFHTPFLVVTYMVHRYNWMEVGLFVFLTAADQASLSAINWAAWDEFMERCSDNLTDVSPHMGVVVQQPRLHGA